jgi:outer membrane protein
MNASLRAGALLLFSLATLTCYSQDNKKKLGYVDISTVLQGMPAYKDAQKKIQGYIAQMQQQLTAMQKEDSTKTIAYQKDEPTLASPIKEIRQQEIVDLEDRIQKLQESSQDQIGQKQTELLKPTAGDPHGRHQSRVYRKGIHLRFQFERWQHATLLSPQ